MKLKLTKAQLQALYSLFRRTVFHEESKPTNMQALLLYHLLYSIYKKLHARALDNKPKYSISLAETEALAFYLFFTVYAFPSEMVYEANLVSTINNHIHQTFS